MISFHRTMVFMLAAMLSSLPLHAHEGHAHHLMGVVTALDGDGLIVKTPDEKTVIISVTSNTVYRNGRSAQSRAGLAVGDRVVIELTIDGLEQSPEGPRGVAKEIRFAPVGPTQ